MNKFEETLKKIESMENKWRYTLSEKEDKEHSYGRVPEDGREVALWSIPRSTGNFLKFMADFTKSQTIFELGSSAGYSTLFLAKAAEKNDGHVYTTEILPEKIKLSKEHFSEAGMDKNITLMEDDIKNVLNDWNESRKIDLVFMDADKENYSEYLDLLMPLLHDRGLIIVDNAGKVRMPDGSLIDSKHIKKFVERVQNDENINSTFLNVDNGLLLISKNN